MILHDPSAPFTVVRSCHSWAFPSTLYGRTSTNQSVVPAKSFAAASAQSCKHQVLYLVCSKLFFCKQQSLVVNKYGQRTNKMAVKYFWPFGRFRIEGQKHYILPRHFISQPVKQLTHWLATVMTPLRNIVSWMLSKDL